MIIGRGRYRDGLVDNSGRPDENTKGFTPIIIYN